MSFFQFPIESLHTGVSRLFTRFGVSLHTWVYPVVHRSSSNASYVPRAIVTTHSPNTAGPNVYFCISELFVMVSDLGDAMELQNSTHADFGALWGL